MEESHELNRFYLAQLTLLLEIKRIYKYLDNHELLDKESEIRFRTLLKQGKTDLWKNFLFLKKSYRSMEENKKKLRRQITYGNYFRDKPSK